MFSACTVMYIVCSQLTPSSLKEIRERSQSLVTDLVGQSLSVDKAEDSFEVWITNGSLPQQGDLMGKRLCLY